MDHGRQSISNKHPASSQFIERLTFVFLLDFPCEYNRLHFKTCLMLEYRSISFPCIVPLLLLFPGKLAIDSVYCLV